MIALSLLLLILVVVGGIGAAVVSNMRRSSSGSTQAELQRWLDADLISEEQRSAIVAFERARIPQPVGRQPVPAPLVETPAVPPAVSPAVTPAVSPAPRRAVPVVAEALGYLGGILALVGLGLIVGRYWADMPTAARLAFGFVTSVVLIGSGAAIRERTNPALVRLQAFLWLIGTGAVGLFTVVLVRDAFDVSKAETIVLATAAAVTVASAALWQGRASRPLHEATMLIGALVMVGAAMLEFADLGPAGLVIWTAGVAYIAVARWVAVPNRLLLVGLGAIAALVGAVMIINDWEGFGFLWAAGTIGALLAIAVVPGLGRALGDEITCGAIGAAGGLQILPPTIAYWAQGAGVATGLIVWTIGVVCIGLALRNQVRLAPVVEAAGALTCIGGAAIIGVQWHGFAPLFGIATAVALIALGMLPGRVVLSVLGSVGLLINVPWAISWFFPGENRAPLLISVTGVLIVLVALLLVRRGGGVHGHPA